MALSILTNIYSEDAANQKIFLFEPDLVSKLASTLTLPKELPCVNFLSLTLLEHQAA